MKRKLLIVNQNQFGYHVDYVKYTRYLKRDFDITFLCWNYDREVVQESGISIFYISREGNILKRNLRFIWTIIKFIKKNEYHFILINYFRGCCIIPILFNLKNAVHLDIRSGGTMVSFYQRLFYNSAIHFESYFFKSISIISEGLRRQLKISKSAYILPLGAEVISLQRKLKHKISLLYVGCLGNRRIDDTIIGIEIFLRDHPFADLNYTIIGTGEGNELEKLNKMIVSRNLTNYVFTKGFIPHNKLISYYERANVGISYVPITPYYTFQPVTKTYEYLMAGMPVIATGTIENKYVINESNGVIIDDTPESFAEGIRKIYYNISNYNEERVKKSVSENQWEKIVCKMKNTLLVD